jgi:Flp pilus assembly protein TadG
VTARLSRRRWSRRGEDGFVTAELALALPTLVLVLVAGIWLQSAVALHARCQDAARAGARAAARGDSDGQIRSALATALPSGATVGIARAGGVVTVSVSAPASAPAGLADLVSAPTLRAAAVAAVERTDPASAVPRP